MQPANKKTKEHNKEMNKTFKLALGAVLTAGIVMPVFAQDNFPDVPDNHWAYEALARLKKDGLLVGYPDGLFRGNRPASRYELAVAIHATYVHLKSITDGLQTEIDQLKANDVSGQIQSLKDAIAQLQDEVNGMKGWGADIDNLKKLADQFQKELASLGVDVEGLKKDLADLSKRVGVLEAHRLPFDIHGDASFYLIGGNSSGREYGITVDGQPVGGRLVASPGTTTTTITGRSTLVPAGIDQDSAIYHELTLKLTSNNDTGPKWHGDIVIGDLLGGYTSTQSYGPGGTSAARFAGAGSTFAPGGESVYVQDLAVDFDTSIVGQGLAAELGRTGYEVDPYIFKRPDVLPYFTNDRWGDGKWYFDGGILGFHWSGVKLDVFGGKQDGQTSTSNNVITGVGTPLGYQAMAVGALGHSYNNLFGLAPSTGAIPVDEELGLNLGIPLGQNGKLDLAYIWFESNTGSSVPNVNTTYPLANRADVYGGTLKYNLSPGFKLNAGYSASDLDAGSHSYTTKANYAWHASLAYDVPKWGAEAGYRQIEPQFGAPGDWGRIGTWWNPTDIEGPWVNAHVKLTDQLTLKASGEWYTGTGTSITLPTAAGGAVQTGLSTNDNVASYKADLGYKLNEAWDFDLGFEYVPFDVQGVKPYESWYNFGLGYNLSDQARLSFLYQYSAADPKGSSFLSSGTGSTKLAGSLLTTQLTVKF
jgi:hypothetical protein